MDELAPGAKIERYTVEEKLGEGGMAAVYRVRHDTLGTLHALKVLTVGGKKVRARLVHEGRVQAMLDHPNVVAVRDVLDIDGAPGLLMDFVDGPDLEHWIRAHRPDPALATEIFRQVVRAVQAAHHLGVVHRDLKPANVLMRRRSNGAWQPKVADFGLAKALSEDDEGKGMGMTKRGAAMGTPAFMAPEQIRDASSVDHRADIWALGCIYYQLVTGEQAFDGEDVLEVFNSVSSGEFVVPSTIHPDLPPEIDEVVAGCLVVDVERRLKSCDAVLAVLEGEDPDSVSKTWEGVEIRSDAPSSPPPRAQKTFDAELGPPPSQAPATPRTHQPQSASPAADLPARTPFAWAIPLVAALVVGGGSLAGVMGIVWLATTLGGSAANCSGWVKAPSVIFTPKTGSVWSLPRDREVVSALPGEGNQWKAGEASCTLPSGTKVTLIEDPVRLGRAGIWVRVLPDNIELPPPKPEAQATQ